MIHKHIKFKRNAWPQRDFPPGPEYVCVCVCAWKGGGGSGGAEWDQEEGLVDFNWKISPASEETAKSHPWSNFDKKKKSTFLLPCAHFIKRAQTNLSFTLNCYIWAAHLMMILSRLSRPRVFISVFPLNSHCAATGSGMVSSDRVSPYLCLLLWLVWQKPINTTLPPLYLFLHLTLQKERKKDSYSAKAHKAAWLGLTFFCASSPIFLFCLNSLHT